LAKCWNANLEFDIKRNKKALMEELTFLTSKPVYFSSPGERDRWKEIYRDLNSYWVVEEIKSKQRSKDNYIVEQDRKTVYFRAIANERRR
jgi:hypothetical protein